MTTFSWCKTNQHKECKRSFKEFYMQTVKGKVTLVYTGEVVYCECSKRGCQCYVKAADRKKTKPTRRKV